MVFRVSALGKALQQMVPMSAEMGQRIFVRASHAAVDDAEPDCGQGCSINLVHANKLAACSSGPPTKNFAGHARTASGCKAELQGLNYSSPGASAL